MAIGIRMMSGMPSSKYLTHTKAGLKVDLRVIETAACYDRSVGGLKTKSKKGGTIDGV